MINNYKNVLNQSDESADQVVFPQSLSPKHLDHRRPVWTSEPLSLESEHIQFFLHGTSAETRCHSWDTPRYEPFRKKQNKTTHKW